MKIIVKSKGNFEKTINYFGRLRKAINIQDLEKFGEEGVTALKNNTPIDSGLTSESWYYEITEEKNKVIISFNNSNINEHVPIAIILQYGHATKNGGWVEGIDYINPAIQPVFNEISKKAWREIVKL